MTIRLLIILQFYASFYNSKFEGRKTANGELFYNSEFTVAHKTLPFGTKLKVTNKANNKSVIVRVTDRGPFTKGRSLDLSQKAFRQISSLGVGTIKVSYEVFREKPRVVIITKVKKNLVESEYIVLFNRKFKRNNVN